MGLYRYEAVDKTGKLVRGVMNAGDEKQVTQNLTRMGYAPRSIQGSGGSQPTARPSTVAAPAVMAGGRGKGIEAVTLASGVPVSIKSKIPAARLAVFFRQLATLVRSGIPLYQSLMDIAPMVRDARLRDALPRIQETMQTDRKLAGAMAGYPDVFPVHTIASVWAGELAGKLDVALDEIASDLEQEASETRYGRFGWFITKISVISLVFCLPMSNLVGLLMPGLSANMNGAGLSWQQTVMVMLRSYMQTMFWKSAVATLVMIVLWILWGYMKRNATVRRMADGALIHVPIWGALHRYRALSRFAHVMDGLYAAGISPNSAWDAASLTPKNSYIAEKLRLTQSSTAGGAGMAEMMASSGVFDIEDVGLVQAGEKAGQIPSVLANVSATYADKAAAQRTMARAWAASLLILFSIVFTGWIMIRVVASYVDLAFKAADMVGK